MNKKELRHQLIRSIVSEKQIRTQYELLDELKKNGFVVTQATLSRDIKDLNMAKISDGHASYYTVHNISHDRWERRLRNYMEDALVTLIPVQHQVILKTLPGLAQSFGSIIDELNLEHIIATVCGDDVCLIICEDNEKALLCYENLKEYAPPFFFSAR